MSDVKRRKISHGSDAPKHKHKKQKKEERAQSPQSEPSVDEASSEEESATVDASNSGEAAEETPKTFSELVRHQHLIKFVVLLRT